MKMTSYNVETKIRSSNMCIPCPGFNDNLNKYPMVQSTIFFVVSIVYCVPKGSNKKYCHQTSQRDQSFALKIKKTILRNAVSHHESRLLRPIIG